MVGARQSKRSLQDPSLDNALLGELTARGLPFDRRSRLNLAPTRNFQDLRQHVGGGIAMLTIGHEARGCVA